VSSRAPVSAQVLVDWANLHLSCGASAPYLPRITISSRPPTANIAQAQSTAQATNSRVHLRATARTWQNLDIPSASAFSWGANLAHCNGPLCHYHFDMTAGTGQNFSFPLLPHDDACLFWEGTVWVTDACGRRNKASVVFKVAEAEQFCTITQAMFV